MDSETSGSAGNVRPSDRATAAGATDEQLRLVHNNDQRRYEAHLDDRLVGFSEYIAVPGRVIFTHTEVDPAVEGRGIGSLLVRFELDDVRRRGLKVSPRCPFVRAYIARHRQYQDLLAQ